MTASHRCIGGCGELVIKWCTVFAGKFAFVTTPLLSIKLNKHLLIAAVCCKAWTATGNVLLFYINFCFLLSSAVKIQKHIVMSNITPKNMTNCIRHLSFVKIHSLLKIYRACQRNIHTLEKHNPDPSAVGLKVTKT